MSHPMISVVMPVYNAEKYVAEAIESILNQTYLDFEFIIIDDCSTDGSYKILEQYANQDKRIRLFRNDVNSKLPKTLNFGILQATGKYIARMDADDISLPERFAKQLEFMKINSDISVVGSFFTEIDENGVERRHVQRFTKSEQIKVGMYFINCCIAHPSVMVRRDIFINLGILYSIDSIAEDYALWLELLHNGVKFANIPEYLLLYRKSAEQISSKNIILLNDSRGKLIGQYMGKALNLDKFTIDIHLKIINLKKKSFKYLLFLPIIYIYILRLKNINYKVKAFSIKDFDLVVDCLYPHNQLINMVTHKYYF